MLHTASVAEGGVDGAAGAMWKVVWEGASSAVSYPPLAWPSKSLLADHR